MKSKFKLANTTISFSVSSVSPKRITHSLRLNCAKAKILSFSQLIKLSGEEPRKCGFCGQDDHRFLFEYTINGEVLTLIGLNYVDDLYYCKKPGCPGKKLNANSIEFISRSRKLSTEDAIKFLHLRNKSPFYRENHESEESYSNFQNIFKNKSAAEIKEITTCQTNAKSLKTYIQKFGEKDGTIKWKLIQSKKKITIENLSRIYSLEEATNKVTNWIQKTRPNLINFIKRYGEEIGKLKYVEFVNKSTRGRSSFGKKTFLDGHHFYSLMELDFYNRILELGYNGKIEHDKNYPDSTRRSDFFFPELNLHLEIAGMRSAEYMSRLNEKQTKYGCLVVYCREEYDTMIHDLIKRYEDATNISR